MKTLFGSTIVFITMLVSQVQTPVYAAETLSLQDVLQRVAANYTDIRIAAMQVDKAQQDVRVVQAQLGWMVNGQGSVGTQPGLGGVPVQQNNLSMGISRQSEKGNSLSLSGGYNYDGTTIAPLLDPTTTYSIDLNYRIPLGQGKGNTQYQEGVVGAKAGADIAEANLYLLRDNIARTIMDLYFGAAQTWYSLKNANDSLDRAKRLLEYERKNVRLGLSENRDLLNQQSQLHAAEADLNNMRQMWIQQRTSLNHLMGRPWDAEFVPVIASLKVPGQNEQTRLLKEIESYDPRIRISQAELTLAESKIRTQTDAQKNRLDIVMGSGLRNRSSGGSTSNDVTYNLGFEYQRSMNRDGFDAQMYQAQLDRDIAKDKLRASRTQIQYDIASLIQRIYRIQEMVRASDERLEAQRLRFADVKQRYNEGRATIAELMMIEAELQGTEFILQQQRIELLRQLTTLNLMRGQLWLR